MGVYNINFGITLYFIININTRGPLFKSQSNQTKNTGGLRCRPPGFLSLKISKNKTEYTDQRYRWPTVGMETKFSGPIPTPGHSISVSKIKNQRLWLLSQTVYTDQRYRWPTVWMETKFFFWSHPNPRPPDFCVKN